MHRVLACGFGYQMKFSRCERSSARHGHGAAAPARAGRPGRPRPDLRSSIARRPAAARDRAQPVATLIMHMTLLYKSKLCTRARLDRSSTTGGRCCSVNRARSCIHVDRSKNTHDRSALARAASASSCPAAAARCTYARPLSKSSSTPSPWISIMPRWNCASSLPLSATLPNQRAPVA